jgi:hypothetical protein
MPRWRQGTCAADLLEKDNEEKPGERQLDRKHDKAGG